MGIACGIVQLYHLALISQQGAAAARLIVAGGAYWKTANGGMRVVRDAILMDTTQRDRSRIERILGITVRDDPQHACDGNCPALVMTLLGPLDWSYGVPSV